MKETDWKDIYHAWGNMKFIHNFTREDNIETDLIKIRCGD
jgi:hypothetical protein